MIRDARIDSFAQLQFAVHLRDETPVDVGVQVEGNSSMLFDLPLGIKIETHFSIPKYQDTGGEDGVGGKKITFPTQLRTRVKVPWNIQILFDDLRRRPFESPSIL
mmetsp:Transcript_14672/g.14471  ORF Transcript_14672/g.14471 Transcript_14672/m.14471 type:complete len:105 (+) Transcript_14672:337-651(+)